VRSMSYSMLLTTFALVVVGAAEAGGKRCKRRCAPPPPTCCPYTTCWAVTSNPPFAIDITSGQNICLSFPVNVYNVQSVTVEFFQGIVPTKVGELQVSSWTTGQRLQVYGTSNHYFRYTEDGRPYGPGLSHIKLTVTFTTNPPMPLAPMYGNAANLL
jgi:hypothetical protein